jgi:2-keto-4-pentenoate hydratase/2-oxohepta-3-ene-1,7-dioic acid hydratase in catechol pathway
MDGIRVACIRHGSSHSPQPALVHGDKVHVLSGSAFPGGVADLISAVHEATLTGSKQPLEALLARATDVLPLRSVTLCAPLPASCTVVRVPVCVLPQCSSDCSLGDQPGLQVCIGKNYSEHVKEVDSTLPGISNAAVPTAPIVFCKAAGSVCGPKDAIQLPPGWEQVDYEGELGVVIGRPGRGIPASAWRDHVLGYTVVNDVSARDVQKRHQQWFLAKSADTFCPTGPWIVPRAGWMGATHGDGEPAVRLRTWVDGQLRQDGNTADMMFRIPQLVETISAGMTLRAGDVIATGTPAGVGAGFKPPRWLAPGATVRVEVDQVGVIENRVIARSKQ